MLKRAYYTMITISKLAKIIRADIPKGFNGSKICGRVLTQAIYVKPGDVVIIMAYAMINQEEAMNFKPKVIFPEAKTNKI